MISLQVVQKLYTEMYEKVLWGELLLTIYIIKNVTNHEVVRTFGSVDKMISWSLTVQINGARNEQYCRVGVHFVSIRFVFAELFFFVFFWVFDSLVLFFPKSWEFYCICQNSPLLTGDHRCDHRSISVKHLHALYIKTIACLIVIQVVNFRHCACAPQTNDSPARW